MRLGSATCGGMRGVVCPISGGMLSKFIGCVFQWGMLACVSRSFMTRMGVGSSSNFEQHGGASKLMMGVCHSCVVECSLTLGI